MWGHSYKLILINPSNFMIYVGKNVKKIICTKHDNVFLNCTSSLTQNEMLESTGYTIWLSANKKRLVCK